MAPLSVVAAAGGLPGQVQWLRSTPYYLFLVAILTLELALALHHNLAVTTDVHVLGVVEVHRLPGHHGLQGGGLLLVGQGLAIGPLAQLDCGLEPLVHLLWHLPDSL